MDSHTIFKLIDLNQQFYQTFALQFSQTRKRLQPGVRRIIESLPPAANILDLGCGNGELARQLAQRGHKGSYVGLDFSDGLLAEARKTIPPDFKAIFKQVDLAQPGWTENLEQTSFDIILAFALLHHLPGYELRRKLLQSARSLLAQPGLLIHSEWQFLNSPRLVARIQPWESIGLAQLNVDPQDYLLDWRQGGYGLRYIHLFDVEELEQLAAASGFKILETFYSDGEGGKLSLYQTWGQQPD